MRTCDHKDHYVEMLISGTCWHCVKTPKKVKVRRDPMTGAKLEQGRKIVEQASTPF